MATLHGLTISSAEIPLTKGLTIAQPDALEGLPPGALAASEEDGGGHLVVVLALDEDDPREAIARGREVLKDLLRALRLFGDGRVTLGALAWARVGGGAWNPLALGAGGRPRGLLVVGTEQEDELRALLQPRLTARSARQRARVGAAALRARLRARRAPTKRSPTTCSRCARCSSPEVEPSGSGCSRRASRRCAPPPRSART